MGKAIGSNVRKKVIAKKNEKRKDSSNRRKKKIMKVAVNQTTERSKEKIPQTKTKIARKRESNEEIDTRKQWNSSLIYFGSFYKALKKEEKIEVMRKVANMGNSQRKSTNRNSNYSPGGMESFDELHLWALRKRNLNPTPSVPSLSLESVRLVNSHPHRNREEEEEEEDLRSIGSSSIVENQSLDSDQSHLEKFPQPSIYPVSYYDPGTTDSTSLPCSSSSPKFTSSFINPIMLQQIQYFTVIIVLQKFLQIQSASISPYITETTQYLTEVQQRYEALDKGQERIVAKEIHDEAGLEFQYVSSRNQPDCRVQHPPGEEVIFVQSQNHSAQILEEQPLPRVMTLSSSSSSSSTSSSTVPQCTLPIPAITSSTTVPQFTLPIETIAKSNYFSFLLQQIDNLFLPFHLYGEQQPSSSKEIGVCTDFTEILERNTHTLWIFIKELINITL